MNGERGTQTVVVNKEREWQRSMSQMSHVMVGKKVTKVSVAHKTVNSEPKNIILGSLESL
jgi:hypothetical protein